MDAIDRVDACIQILKGYQDCALDCFNSGGQQDEPPAIAFQRGFSFGLNTLEAIRVLLPRAEFAPMVQILIRPFYEFSLRILWASREPSGWHRWQASQARENEKWANGAVSSEHLAEHARNVQAVAREILKRVDEHGEPYPPMPPVEQLLRENEERDKLDGYREYPGDGGLLEYSMIYRILSRPTHAHLSAIAPPKLGATLPSIIVSVVMATFYLLRAFVICAAEDERDEHERVGRKLLDLLKGCNQLSFGRTINE